MPRGDGTGPDGNGPKCTNKGYPSKDGRGRGRGRGGPDCRIGGPSKRSPQTTGSRTTKIGGTWKGTET